MYQKKLGRTLLGFLLTLLMVIGLMPGMGLTVQVKAESVTTPLTIKKGDYIRMGAYNGYDVDWFCAKVNKTGTMMMSKYVIKNSRFGANATYKTSDIHSWLDLNSGGTFATDLGLTKKVKGIAKGSCTIYVYGRNGFAKTVKVTVK